MKQTAVALALFLACVITACGNAEGSGPSDRTPGPGPTPDPRMEGSRLHGIWPQVYAQHAPAISSWEYKVNCGEADSHTEPCFLSDLTAVNVEWPDGTVIELD